MEVAVAEEKKKIFRARKTMKISDRQQLESLHSTLSSPVPPQSSAPPPQTPLVNGTHTADGLKGADKEQNDTDLKSSRSTSPVSQASRSPPLILTLSLSPSPPSHSSNAKEGTPPSPPSPFHSLNSELKRMEEEGRKECSVSPSNETRKGQDKEVTTKMEDKKKEEKEATGTKKEETCTTTEDKAADSPKDSQSSAVSPGMSAKESGKDKGTEQDDIVAMETDKDSVENKAPEEKSRSPKVTTTAAPKATTASPSNLSPTSAPEADQDIKEEEEGDKGKKDDNQKAKEGLTEKVEKNMEEKMQVVSVKREFKVKAQVHSEFNGATSSHPSSTSSSDTVAKEEKGTVSGQKRPISEGDGKDGLKVEREGKRQRVDGVELEAQLELKITANAGSRLKLEKVVQQLVEERLRVLQLTVFDQNLQELKDRVEKIDSATKHQSTLNTLQAKIARLAKKFGEANQASENKRKQEQALTSPVAKTTPMTNTTPTQRLVRTTTEVKQTPTAPGPTNPTVSSAQPKPSPTATTTMVSSQTPYLQLIPTTSNTSSTLATVSSQSQTGTLLLKATSGSNMVGQGQPLLIQLPLSGVNGQPGTLVNIPVSSFAAVNSLNKAMTTTPGATYILKAAPSTPTMSTAVPGLQASSTHLSPAQVTLARAVYQGGAGGISTPSAGVSVTTARAPAMCAPVAGVVSSSSSSSVASGPAATGSAPPGTPSGTAMTSKTDNQATGSTPTKTPGQGPRLKNSFIDLTEDDDDVQVTGVSKAKVTTVSSSVTQRTSGPPPLISTPTGTTARASPQSSVSSPQLTVHHRPPLDSPSKARLGNTTTPSRAPSTALPPLPTAPPPTTRLPLEAAQTSAPQQPQLKLARVQSQNGIVLSWCVAETDRSCAAVESYHLYAYHQEASGPSSAQQHWKKIGEVKALRLPMACTLTQFVSGSTYYFAVRARDVYGRFGLFCEPQCTDVINVIPASS